VSEEVAYDARIVFTISSLITSSCLFVPMRGDMHHGILFFTDTN